MLYAAAMERKNVPEQTAGIDRGPPSDTRAMSRRSTGSGSVSQCTIRRNVLRPLRKRPGGYCEVV